MPTRSTSPRVVRTPYQQLLDAIIRGQLAPGARVVETEVATRLGVSRTPVREVLHRLHQEGFVVAMGAGARTQLAVAPMTIEDMRDLYAIMAALEGAAAAEAPRLEAAERRALATRLRAANDRFVRIAKQRAPDFEELFERHNAFHDEIVQACASARLTSLIDRVRPQVDRYEYVYAPLVGPDHGATFAEHDAIIRAVAKGTASAAERALRANWTNGAERLHAAMSRSGPRGIW